MKSISTIINPCMHVLMMHIPVVQLFITANMCGMQDCAGSKL